MLWLKNLTHAQITHKVTVHCSPPSPSSRGGSVHEVVSDYHFVSTHQIVSHYSGLPNKPTAVMSSHYGWTNLVAPLYPPHKLHHQPRTKADATVIICKQNKQTVTWPQTWQNLTHHASGSRWSSHHISYANAKSSLMTVKACGFHIVNELNRNLDFYSSPSDIQSNVN